MRGVGMVATVFCEGERIYLRSVEPADEARVRIWLNHPANWRTLDRGFPLNEVRERACIPKLDETQENCELLIVVKEDDRPIGVTGLYQMGRAQGSATFGMIIGDREYQSRGFGTEAAKLVVRLGFEEFKLNRIELTVFANNERAIRACKRVGFTLEGRSREAYFHTGQYVDVLRYAILRSDGVAPEESLAKSSVHEVPSTSAAALLGNMRSLARETVPVDGSMGGVLSMDCGLGGRTSLGVVQAGPAGRRRDE